MALTVFAPHLFWLGCCSASGAVFSSCGSIYPFLPSMICLLYFSTCASGNLKPQDFLNSMQTTQIDLSNCAMGAAACVSLCIGISEFSQLEKITSGFTTYVFRSYIAEYYSGFPVAQAVVSATHNMEEMPGWSQSGEDHLKGKKWRPLRYSC